MGGVSIWRWLIVILAVMAWGYPLSVLSDRLDYGPEPGWLVAVIGVLLGDLFCFIWWLGLEAKSADAKVSASRTVAAQKRRSRL
jgi:uncharacterized membrane protein YdjX (TVP38/TMEM64 family)